MKDPQLQGAVLIALVLSMSLFGCESNHAEKYSLAVYGAVHVYRNNIPPTTYPGSDFIAVMGPKDHVTVVQVIKKRDHTAVKIRLSDGRQGWVFSGESVELYEPGCRGADFQAC